MENWQYNIYEINLRPGRHALEATVWKLGGKGPLAQLSWRGGFILKANDPYDGRLTTGVAKWKVGMLSGFEPMGVDNGVWGTGSQWQITGSGILWAESSALTDAEVVRGPAGHAGSKIYGHRSGAWMLFPSQLPDRTEREVCPGRIVAVTREAPWRGKNAYTEFRSKHPRPRGFIEADLKFADGKAYGTVNTPVPGAFIFGDQRQPLVPGDNVIY